MPETATRTRSRRKAATRSRLLDTASSLFAERGLGQVSVDEIIREAGSSKGSFYHHFRSRDELVVALIDDHTEKEIDALAECLADVKEGQPAEVCEGVFKMIVRAYEDPARVRTFMDFWVYASRSQEARGAISRMYGRWRAKLEDLLRRGMEAGVTGPDIDPPTAATALIAVHHGLLLQASVDPGGMKLLTSADALGRMLLGFLGAPPTDCCAWGKKV